jgi:hypothetical protein
MEKCIILKNGLDYQKKRVKRKDTSDEKIFLMNSKSLSAEGMSWIWQLELS